MLKIVRLAGSLANLKKSNDLDLQKESFIATLGNFDGVHLGHQKILKTINSLKTNSDGITHKTAVFSFYPHPATVINPDNKKAKVSSLNEVVEILQSYKIDYLFLVHFTKETINLSAQEFLDHYILSRINLTELVIGSDAHIGKNREGTPNKISELLSKKNIKTTTVEFAEIDQHKISSRDIRESIKKGDFKEVARSLGRPFVLDGKVAHGQKRGASIGFPTVNLYIGKRELPPLGVYAGKVLLDGKEYKVALNIGSAPTFMRKKVLIEGHIIGYKGVSLYRRRIKIELLSKIRDVMKFNSVDELVEQIKKDLRSPSYK